MDYLLPMLAIGGIGLVFGLILSYAGEKLKVEEDERIPLVRDVLPGANCGGCGFAGCDAFAVAIVEGKCSPNGCPVGGQETAEAVCEVMGLVAEESEKTVAYVKCAGDCDKASDKYEYFGVQDCNIQTALPSGTQKSCNFGCMGGGSCVKACDFDAIHIVNGIAIVDEDKCVSCGACVGACPKALIEIVPQKMEVRVNCSSKDNGKTVREACTVGCIACKICEKNCPHDAIHVNDMLAKVDYEKCTLCEVCVGKCPTKAIRGVKEKANKEKNEEKEIEINV